MTDRDWQQFFDQLAELPQQRRGGFIVSMTDAAEYRQRGARTAQPQTPRRRLSLLDIQLETDLREVRLRHSERTLRNLG